jgi:hypothetical protein
VTQEQMAAAFLSQDKVYSERFANFKEAQDAMSLTVSHIAQTVDEINRSVNIPARMDAEKNKN